MKRIQKIVGWIAAAALLSVIGIRACWWLLPDEKLDPAAVDFASQELPPPPAQNGGFLIWGFEASPELDPHAIGRSIVTDHDRLLGAEKNLQQFQPDSSLYLGKSPLKLPADYTPLCNARKQHCLPLLLANAATIAEKSVTYRVYLDRYRHLREFDHFQTATPWLTSVSPLPAWSPILRMAELVDGAIAQGMLQPTQHQGALQELAAEIRLWRRLLQADDVMLTKMIAVNMLHQKYELASDILNRFPTVVNQYPALVQQITTPLIQDETTLASSLHAEYIFRFNTLRDAEQLRALEQSAPLKWLLMHGYQPNATANQYYHLFRPLMDFYSANPTPRTLVAADSGLLRQMTKEAAFTPGAIFYNPGGRLLNAGVVDSTWSGYSLRIHRVIAQSRLLEIQRRLMAEQVPADRIEATLAAWSPALDDPFSEKPMQWNAATRTLSFAQPDSQNFSKDPDRMSTVTINYLKQ